MGRKFIARSILFTSLLLAAIVLFGCDNGDDLGGDADADVQPDPDAVEDVTPEPDAEAEIPTDVPQDDPAEDLPEEELPGPCAGTDTLTLEFLDGDDNPLEGVTVALRCLDEQLEAQSGADGRVTFEGINITDNTVDLTYVYDDRAWSLIGLGGARSVPDTLTFYLGMPSEPTWTEFEGDVVHSVYRSTVLVNAEYWFWWGSGDRYWSRSTAGATNVPMSVWEYTADADYTATILGYSFIRFDAPRPGADGPVASASSSAAIHTKTLEVFFDIRDGSPLEVVQHPSDLWIDYTCRPMNGLRLYGNDPDGRQWLAGFTTSWVEGETSDTIGFAWAEEALASADETTADIMVIDSEHTYASWVIVPGAPDTWTSVTVFDVPEVPGFSTEEASPFDSEISVVVPDWGENHMLSIYDLSYPYPRPVMYHPMQWEVTLHPEVTSFRFTDLPWPESIDRMTIFPYPTLELLLGAMVNAYDQDPFDNYQRWTDKSWGTIMAYRGIHMTGQSRDIRYLVEHP